MGLAGADWTFVKAGARRLLGGLRGASERVRRGRGRVSRRAAAAVLASILQTLARLPGAHKKVPCSCAWET